MVRVSVTGNNSFIVDAIAHDLANAICPDVLHLSYMFPMIDQSYICDHHSIIIRVDEGEAGEEVISEAISHDEPVLLIQVSLKSRNIHFRGSYPIPRQETGRVSDLVREFSRACFRKETDVMMEAAGE